MKERLIMAKEIRKGMAFDMSLDDQDFKKLFKAVTHWEHEFDTEEHMTKSFLQLDSSEFEIPEEHQEEFLKYFQKMQKKLKRRQSELSSAIPDRVEEVTMLRAKLLFHKQEALGKLFDDAIDDGEKK